LIVESKKIKIKNEIVKCTQTRGMLRGRRRYNCWCWCFFVVVVVDVDCWLGRCHVFRIKTLLPMERNY